MRHKKLLGRRKGLKQSTHNQKRNGEVQNKQSKSWASPALSLQKTLKYAALQWPRQGLCAMLAALIVEPKLEPRLPGTPPDSHYYPPGQGSSKGCGCGHGQGWGGSVRRKEEGADGPKLTEPKIPWSSVAKILTIQSTATRVYCFVPNPTNPIWENQNWLLGGLHKLGQSKLATGKPPS
jgi:hypothetical protein